MLGLVLVVWGLVRGCGLDFDVLGEVRGAWLRQHQFGISGAHSLLFLLDRNQLVPVATVGIVIDQRR
ncbi:hypothetical protein, partial [Pseudomonas syringae group genomosp. 7]|uniref:hypothetical protein n=1 Tax=Pseudomonas syringae group genomosp. 7 TaxID=251699 RepID=UPI00376FE95B